MKDLDIIRQECECFYNIPHEAFQSKTRKGEVVKCRQQAIYLARELLKMWYEPIGKEYAGLDRSTCTHAFKTVKNLCQVNRVYKEEFELLRDIVKKQLDNYRALTVSMELRNKDSENGEGIVFNSTTEAFNYYRDNQVNIDYCVISIVRAKPVQVSEFTATNEPIEIDLK